MPRARRIENSIASATLLCVCLLMFTMVGCSSSKALGGWKARAPDNPGTAEQLAGTAWEVQGSFVLFQADGSVALVLANGGTTPMPETQWSIEDGVVTVTKGDEFLFECTWDGTTLIANGYPARTIQQAVSDEAPT